MKLRSHGQDSDLLCHLREVASAAEEPWERVILLCHDIGKASLLWQEYIRGLRHDSPYSHAAAGGVLAASILLEAGGDNAVFHALIALHVGAAHHSNLSALSDVALSGLVEISSDLQAEAFFKHRSEGIASLLPEFPDSLLENAWNRFKRLSNLLGNDRLALNELMESSLSGERLLEAFLEARSLLGRLGWEDGRSAAGQSGRTAGQSEWKMAFGIPPFRPRPLRKLPDGSQQIFRLRTELRGAFLKTVDETNALFTFIDAPTGLGKTEAMLQAAEHILTRENLSGIVFAVPQVSIADQIFEEYVGNASSAQIWNYRRKEKSCGSSPSPETLSGNGSDSAAFEAEEYPFSRSYNVTTFNQVLLAMCHPLKGRCIRSLGLKNSVVVMDEFHKLPMTILPLFFRFARRYALKNRLRFILGSATPFRPFPLWDLADSIRIPAGLTAPLYKAPAVDGRRIYSTLGELSLQDLAFRIETFHQDHPDRNLLVVVNLVADASWPLRRNFLAEYNPWRELEKLNADSTDRAVICLDGLVPPILRRDIVRACKQIMKNGKRKITLISTQMIEVGVDLDFDEAFVDFQGLAATIQRGGRVGREGRGTPCPVHVFSLMRNDGKSSFDILADAALKDPRNLCSPFDELNRYTAMFQKRDMEFFRRWTSDVSFMDSELTDSLSALQEKVFANAKADYLLEKLFHIETVSSTPLGASFDNAQYMAELFGPDDRDIAVVVDDRGIIARLTELDRKIRENSSSPEERSEFTRLLADYQISVNRKLFPELGLTEKVVLLSSGSDAIPLFCLSDN